MATRTISYQVTPSRWGWLIRNGAGILIGGGLILGVVAFVVTGFGEYLLGGVALSIFLGIFGIGIGGTEQGAIAASTRAAVEQAGYRDFRWNTGRRYDFEVWDGDGVRFEGEFSVVRGEGVMVLREGQVHPEDLLLV